MDITVGYKCVLMNDAWGDVVSYVVEEVQPDGVLLRPLTDYLCTGPTIKIKKTMRTKFLSRLIKQESAELRRGRTRLLCL